MCEVPWDEYIRNKKEKRAKSILQNMEASSANVHNSQISGRILMWITPSENTYEVLSPDHIYNEIQPES